MMRLTKGVLGAAVAVAVVSAALLSHRARVEGVAQGAERPSGAVSSEPIVAEGFAHVRERDWIVSKIMVEHSFRAKLQEMVPEWTFVEAGQAIGRLYTPALDEDLVAAELRLRSAESALEKARADAEAVLATLESAVADARAAKGSAEEKVAVLEAQPTEEALSELLLKVSRNEAAARHARARKALLGELSRFGLCADVERREASQECERLDAERRELDALLEETKTCGSGPGAEKARIDARKTALDLSIAEIRKEFESKRQPLLCRAIELQKVEAARRELDLIVRRTEAAVLRAPSSGYVEYAYMWNDGETQTKLSKGDPIYFGQQIASIVDVSQMQARTQVDERRLLEVSLRDPAEVEFEAVPGRTYHGCVEQILPLVASDREDLLEIDVGATERKGWVLVGLEDADAHVRPGMKARVTITRAGAKTSQEDTLRAEGPADAGERADDPRASGMVLKGWVKAGALRFLRSPFAGRVTGGAEPGTAVRQGGVILKLDPGLQADWLTEVEAEMERRECEREAAELKLEMEELLAPLRVEAARAATAIARTELEVLESRPLPSERIAAENALAEAQWRLGASRKVLAEFRQLAEKGLASAAEVRQRELQLASAQAAVETTRAGLEEVTRGASELELAMARADLRLGEAGRRKAEAVAGAAVRAAKSELGAARAEREVYREHAARQRAKAEKAELQSPISGILLWRAQEGREVREDWWLAVIADTTRTRVHAALDEPDVSKVPLGASARVRLAGLPGRVLTGKVSSVSDWRLPWWHWEEKTDGKERPAKLFEVVVEVEDDAPPCVGMSAIVEIEGRDRAVPSEASPPVAENTDTR